MKFKKIFVVILLIILMFIFNININADMITAPFTNTYRNPEIQTYMLDASVYAYNNVYVSQYPYDKHIRFLVMEPNLNSSGNRRFRHIYMSFNEIDSQIKLYDGYIYFYVKGYVRYQSQFSQDVLTGSMKIGGQSIGSYSSTSKAVIKMAIDKSSIKYKLGFSDSTINSVDEYIVKEISNSFQYYTLEDEMFFCELNSIGSLTGETFQNNADIQNPQYYGTILSDKQKFINWIITEQKYVVFGDYGVQNTSEFVNDIVNLYETYQKNPMKLFIEFPQFLIKNGSIFSTYDKAKELINYISALYQEFKLERRPVIYEPELLPYIFPQPWVDDAPNEKYVDDVGDSVEIGLLREILRAIIVMPQNIFNFFDYYIYNISVNTSLLADYVAQLPDYLTDLMYNKIISPINTIVYAIENIDTGGGTTSIDVIIPNEKEVEFNDFLQLWNNNFSDIIDNKFPVANQLGTLFDDFFVKAGISTDKDGVVYSYYNGNTVGSSGDSDLSSFYSTFDNANVSYLDDVAYSSDIPSLTIKIKGVNHEIINFKFYAKYRQQIFTIISFILWFAFLLSLYKSLPTIIGNVSDIVNSGFNIQNTIDKGAEKDD